MQFETLRTIKTSLLSANLVVLLFCLASFCPAPVEGAEVQSAAIAPQHCYTFVDYGFCFVHLYEVVAHSDISGALSHYAALTREQQKSAFVLTTNDQTRRAIVVYRRLHGEQPSHRDVDGFVADLFVTVEEARRRYESLDADQKAGAFLLTPSRDSHEAIVVYRTFGKDGAH